MYWPTNNHPMYLAVCCLFTIICYCLFHIKSSLIIECIHIQYLYKKIPFCVVRNRFHIFHSFICNHCKKKKKKKVFQSIAGVTNEFMSSITRDPVVWPPHIQMKATLKNTVVLSEVQFISLVSLLRTEPLWSSGIRHIWVCHIWRATRPGHMSPICLGDIGDTNYVEMFSWKQSLLYIYCLPLLLWEEIVLNPRTRLNYKNMLVHFLMICLLLIL